MNKATSIIVTTLGVLFGISGMNHGFFEMLQGNTPTNGLYISAIGDGQKMWAHGNEFTFTLIPNFLMTGIAALTVGLALIIWSLAFVHKQYGSTVLFLLFVLLLLVGGGIAQILFFPFVCLVAARINKPLTWWKKVLPEGIQRGLGALWFWALLLCSAILLIIFEIGVTGFVPSMSDPEKILSVLIKCLVAFAVTLSLTFISGFAHDIGKEKQQ